MTKRRSTEENSTNTHQYPSVRDVDLVGTYPAEASAGGGYVWDDVLEYRVWCHPECGALSNEEGDDYFFAFSSFAEASAFSKNTQGAEEPLALILQAEYIGEDHPGEYRHVKENRITEWPVEFLLRPRRTPETIPLFFSPQAPNNRLAILRGLDRKNT